MSWPQAFHDVGIAIAVAVGVVGFFHMITRHAR
jgi:hypothetical protein